MEREREIEERETDKQRMTEKLLFCATNFRISYKTLTQATIFAPF